MMMIAAGVVIAGGILGLFWVGLLVANEEGGMGPGLFLILIALVLAGAVIWAGLRSGSPAV